MQSFVVVYDPENEIAEGRIMISDERYFVAVRRGVVMLPVMSDKPGRNAISPWAKFAFGEGPFMNSAIPSYAGRAALWLERGASSVGWAALLRFPSGSPREGLVRLVGDPSQAPLVQAPVRDDNSNRAAVGANVHELHAGPTHVILQGKTACQTGLEGIYAFALHGYARECRLSWLAISQAE